MRPFAIAAAAAILVGLATGWFNVRSARTVAERETMRWTPAPERASADAGAVRQALMDSGHFGQEATIDPEAAAAAAAADDEAAEKIPAFPQIIATASLDGEVAVSLHAEDHTIQTVSNRRCVAWRLED